MAQREVAKLKEMAVAVFRMKAASDNDAGKMPRMRRNFIYRRGIR